MKKNPRHRLKNSQRIESMVRWYETALADARVMDNGDIDELLLDAPPKPDMTMEHQLSLMHRWLRAGSIDNINGLSQDEREVLEWLDELADARKLIPKMKAYEVAAALFNGQLATAQSQGERLDEKPATSAAIQRAVSRYHKSQSSKR
jgi:hypothetical protein